MTDSSLFPGTRTGLVLHKHHLLWGINNGRLQWAPTWAKEVIVFVVNKTTCALLGHDVYGGFVDDEGRYHKKVCTACCKEWGRGM